MSISSLPIIAHWHFAYNLQEGIASTRIFTLQYTIDSTDRYMTPYNNAFLRDCTMCMTEGNS